MDSITFANQALASAEAKMNELTELMEEEFESYSISRWISPEDDDGPYAA